MVILQANRPLMHLKAEPRGREVDYLLSLIATELRAHASAGISLSPATSNYDLLDMFKTPGVLPMNVVRYRGKGTSTCRAKPSSQLELKSGRNDGG